MSRYVLCYDLLLGKHALEYKERDHIHMYIINIYELGTCDVKEENYHVITNH